MFELFQMWALVEILGIICLPLTITVCHNLPDRGWAFSKALGMALLAFAVWLPLMCLHVLPFSQFFILAMLLLIVLGNALAVVRTHQTLVKLFRSQLFYIVAAELLFWAWFFCSAGCVLINQISIQMRCIWMRALLRLLCVAPICRRMICGILVPV